MEWFSVKQKRPDTDERYLTYSKHYEQEIMRYNLAKKQFEIKDENGYAWGVESVTHWMPLPEPPKENQ